MPYRRYARKSGPRRKTNAKSRPRRKKTTSVASLARKVATLTRSVWSNYQTQWSRPVSLFAFGNTGGLAVANAPFVYMCPVPIAPSVQVPGGSVAQPVDILNPRGTFADNGCGANYPNNTNHVQFLKGRTFVSNTNATQSAKLKHTGTVMKWRMLQQQAQYREYTVMLVSPRHDVADQISLQRSLQYFNGDQRLNQPGGPAQAPGYKSYMDEGEDYIRLGDSGPAATSNLTVSSVMLNPKIWRTHYKRVLTLGYTNIPFSTEDANRRSATVDNTGQTPMLASGTIKIPAVGDLRYVAKVNDKTVQATELGLSNQSSEELFYLVIFGKNAVNVAAANPLMGFQVLDNYKVA